jgi:hypothetical protein
MPSTGIITHFQTITILASYPRVSVPDEVSEKCLDPGIKGSSPGKSVCGAGNPSQALPSLTPQRLAVRASSNGGNMY